MTFYIEFFHTHLFTHVKLYDRVQNKHCYPISIQKLLYYLTFALKPNTNVVYRYAGRIFLSSYAVKRHNRSSFALRDTIHTSFLSITIKKSLHQQYGVRLYHCIQVVSALLFHFLCLLYSTNSITADDARECG